MTELLKADLFSISEQLFNCGPGDNEKDSIATPYQYIDGSKRMLMKLPPFPRLSIDLATGHYIVLLARYAPQCPSPTSPAIKKTSTKIVSYLETDLAQGNDASLICYLAARVCPRVDRSSSLYLCWWGRTEKC